MSRDLTSPEVFEQLVREHQSMVFRTLARMTGSARGGTPVEDLAQEVVLRLYRALPEFRGESTISTYLYRIVINVAQDEWKRRRKERTHIVSAPASEDGDAEAWLENFAGDDLRSSHARTPEQLLADAQVLQTVDSALLDLPDQERAVLVLYYQEECSYEGIAAALPSACQHRAHASSPRPKATRESGSRTPWARCPQRRIPRAGQCQQSGEHVILSTPASATGGARAR